MPVSALKKETILKAKQVLGQIGEAIKEMENIRVKQYQAGNYNLGENYEVIQA